MSELSSKEQVSNAELAARLNCLADVAEPEEEWELREAARRLSHEPATALPKPVNHDLWRHLHEAHGLTLTQSEIDDILQLVPSGCDRCERFRDESGHYPYCPVGEGMQQGRCSCNERPSPPPGTDEQTLRRLLAFAYSGDHLYGDDGELQDSRLPFPIDFVRDSVTEIESKISQRGTWTLAKAQAECVPHDWDGFGICRKCMKLAERPTATKGGE
jgi:hypothetical protein